MPGRSGLDILQALDPRHFGAPIFVISAQGDIPMAVSAIKLGAADFIVKPFDPEAVTLRVRQAIEQWQRTPPEDTEEIRAQKLKVFDKLTPREQEVLTLLAKGCLYKEIGTRLGISVTTVRTQRNRPSESSPGPATTSNRSTDPETTQGSGAFGRP